MYKQKKKKRRRMKRSRFSPLTKIKLKWIKDLSVRPETIKLPEENIGGKLLDISLCNNLKKVSLFILRDRESRRGSEREGENLRQALCCQCRALCRARTHKPWDHSLSWKQESDANQMSHPGTLDSFLLLSPIRCF